MGVPGPNELVVLLSMFFSGGFGLPLGVPPEPVDPLLARVAPDECLFYTAWAEMADPDPDSPNQTEQLLAEAEVQQLIKTLTSRLDETLQGAAAQQRTPQAQVVFDAGPKLLKSLITHQAAMFVSKAEFGPSGVDVQAGLILNGGDDIDSIAALLQRLQTEAMGDRLERTDIGDVPFTTIRLAPQLPPAMWGVRGKYLIIGIGEGSVEAMFERAQTEPPQWLVDLHERLHVDRISSISYINVGTLVDTFVPMIPEPKVGQAIEALGLTDVNEFASVAGLDRSGFVNRSWIGLDGPPRGVLAPLNVEPLQAEDLAPIPHDALVASVVRLDLEQVFRTWLDTAGQIDPGAAEDMTEDLAEVEQELGFQIREDLLKSLGDVWTVFTAPADGGLLTGWTATVRVRDRARLAEIHSQLVAKLTAEFSGRSRAPQIKQMEYAGHDVYYLSVPDDDFVVAPAWCLTEDRLVVSLFPQALKAYLSRGDEFQSLADRPGIAKLLQAEPGPLAITYVDSQPVFQTVYPMLQILANIATAQLRRQGLDFDTILLPSGSAIRQHLLPYVAVLRRTDTGIEMISHQTLPGGNIGATAPLAIGMLIPAVTSARGAARRAQSMNNMKQIGIALHNFHDVYRHMPAAYNADEEGKPLLSWRVHVLPFIEQNNLYDQFHFDEPWDSDHNQQLIAQMPPVFRSPKSKAEPGKTVYLGVRGEDCVFIKPKVQQGATIQRAGSGLRDITDGTSNTVMVVEASDEEAVIWTKPDDYEPDDDDPIKGLIGLQRDGFLALFCDASVRFLAENIDRDTLKLLFTKNDGQPIHLP